MRFAMICCLNVDSAICKAAVYPKTLLFVHQHQLKQPFVYFIEEWWRIVVQMGCKQV